MPQVEGALRDLGRDQRRGGGGREGPHIDLGREDVVADPGLHGDGREGAAVEAVQQVPRGEVRLLARGGRKGRGQGAEAQGEL